MLWEWRRRYACAKKQDVVLLGHSKYSEVPQKITQDAVTLQSYSWKSRQKKQSVGSTSGSNGGEKRRDMRVGEDRMVKGLRERGERELG